MSGLEILAIFAEVTCATSISQYHPVDRGIPLAGGQLWQTMEPEEGIVNSDIDSINKAYADTSIEKDCNSYLQIPALEFSIPSYLHDPSPAVFAFASVIFVLAALTYHYLHRHDRFQNTCLSLTVATTSTASIALPQCGSGLWRLQALLPWSIIFALVASALAHRLLRSAGVRWTLRDLEEVGDKQEKQER